MKNTQANELSEALQYYALQRKRNVEWVRRAIRREQWKRLLCRACETAVEVLRKIGL